MKNHLCSTLPLLSPGPVRPPLYTSFGPCFRTQAGARKGGTLSRRFILGLSLLLILLWTIASLWLISARRDQRRVAGISPAGERVALSSLLPALANR